jgi:glycosyltransferase involved in cell wall biosynthesis
MLVSVCVPVYNAEATIEQLVAAVKRVDGLRFISLRRNFGEHNAVMCALNHCSGDYAAIIDDDFQNPPSQIARLLEEAKSGWDVVYSKYRRKKHSPFRNLGSRFNDRVATWLLGKPRDLYLSSFKLIKREIIDEIIRYKGPFPYVDGLILRATNNIGSAYVDHNPRRVGRSNYTLGRLVSLWLNTFLNFSTKPLRLVTFFGLVLSVVCVTLAVVFLVQKLVSPSEPLGWASLIVSVLFIGGVQMVFLGLVGEYLAKLYLDVNGTPQWVVKKEVFSAKSSGSTSSGS